MQMARGGARREIRRNTVLNHQIARTLRGIGFSGALLLLAGCATPRDALTPAAVPSHNGPIASLREAAGPVTPISYTSPPTQITDLPVELQAAWDKAGLSGNSLSLVVAELGQPPLSAINPSAARNPASVMKLVTTYAALEGLGPGYTWRTELLTAATALPRPDGTLPGPLYIRAGGDPQLALADVWRMLRELRLRGIRSLPGIVIDRSVFGDVAIDPGAFDNAPDRVYNASPDALVVGYGAVRLAAYADPASRAWRIQLDPPLTGVRVDNQLRATTAACPGSPAVRTQQTEDAHGLTLRLTGTVALSCGDFSLYRLVLGQPEHAARTLQTLWRDLGGELTGLIVEGTVPPGAVVLAAEDSKPLSEQIRTVNKLSNNVMARMLLLTLGREYGTGPATPHSGGLAVQQVLHEQGLAFPEMVIENGSGLSRHGRISAASLAAMLHAAWNSPRMPEFLSSMAISGEDGTVRRRLRNSSSRGRAHLKTGTLRDVTALAGYVQGASGKRYILVSMINDAAAYKAHSFNNQLVEWLSNR